MARYGLSRGLGLVLAVLVVDQGTRGLQPALRGCFLHPAERPVPMGAPGFHCCCPLLGSYPAPACPFLVGFEQSVGDGFLPSMAGNTDQA
jgi:hypothetical protein